MLILLLVISGAGGWSRSKVLYRLLCFISSSIILCSTVFCYIMCDIQVFFLLGGVGGLYYGSTGPPWHAWYEA